MFQMVMKCADIAHLTQPHDIHRVRLGFLMDIELQASSTAHFIALLRDEAELLCQCLLCFYCPTISFQAAVILFMNSTYEQLQMTPGKQLLHTPAPRCQKRASSFQA